MPAAKSAASGSKSSKANGTSSTSQPPPNQHQHPTSKKKSSKSNSKSSSTSTSTSAKSKQVKDAPASVTAEQVSHRVTDLPCTSITQGSASSLPVLFTKDADYFCVASSSSVKIHSRTTGEVVSTLSAPDASLPPAEARNRAHTAAITGLLIHPTNPLQIITSSLDGTVKVWDYLDAVLLKSIDVGYPITHLAAHSTIKDKIFVAARKPKANAAAGQKPDPLTYVGRANSIIYAVSLAIVAGKSVNAGVASRKPKELLRLGKTRDAAGLQVSPDGKWLVAIGNRKVQIALVADLRAGFTKFVSDERLVSLAFHPTEPTFATGDATGKIRLWHCLDEAYIAQTSQAGGEKRAPNTLLHWHSHAVATLAFTPNGAYLLSGGEEAVLVLWQLNSAAKEFVPRLGAPISSIAVADGMDGREQEFVLALADGSVTFIGALGLKPTRTFARVKMDPSRQLLPPARLASIPAPLAIEPVTGQAVMCGGHPSSLQFFDTVNDRTTLEIEIAPSNRTSRPEDAPLEPTRVDKVVFSSQRATGRSDGPAEWMATVDSRHGGSLSSEVSLKFWRYSASTARYILNTRIDKPHEGEVTSIAFSPLTTLDDHDGLLLVSTGLDRKIKTWRIASHTARGGRLETYWVPRSVFGYREAAPSQAAWSPDGSLLAVAQDAFLTLWEPVSNALVVALSCPELKTSSHLSFVGRAGRYIALANSKTLVCWDLVTSAVKWHQTFAEPIVRVLDTAANGNNAFAVLRKISAGDSRAQRPAFRAKAHTLIDTFDATSAQHLQSFTLPYGVREAVTVASARARVGVDAAAAAAAAAPRFIAIMDNFDTYEVGQSAADVSALQAQAQSSSSSSRAGESAQSLHALGIKRRTLFDDLFGPSMNNGEAPVDQDTQRASQGRQKPTKDLFALFDAPPHLLPPVESLFDAVLQSVLPPRRQDANDAEERADGYAEEGGSDDVEMDDATTTAAADDDDDRQANEAALVRRNVANSAQNERETMELLSDLFKKQLASEKNSSKMTDHTVAATSTPSSESKNKKSTADTAAAGTPRGTPNGVHTSGGGGGASGGKKKKSSSTSSVASNHHGSPSAAAAAKGRGAGSPARAGTKRSSMS